MQVLFKDRAKADATRVGEAQKLYRMSSALLLSWNHLQGCVSCRRACSRGSWLAANFSPGKICSRTSAFKKKPKEGK
jgi:hypothetical protein